MSDSSQEQNVGDFEGDSLQVTQAKRDAIVNSQIIRQSYFSLFGGQQAQADVDWDRAMQILRQEMQPEIKKRLKDSLFGLADVDAVEVRAVGQEDSTELALEAVKTLTSDRMAKAETIDARIPIIQTYAREDVKGKLLILGTPGAGKTITLLKLAEQLVDEAIENPNTVIPIVFELSTWREGQEIEDWLIEQLYENFSANPKRDRKQKIYETWLERRVLLPLMDGLDELGMVQQKACTEKVNGFARVYPYLVVCCRAKEFRVAGVKLNLRGAVQLQPLTDEQIQDYLRQVGRVELWTRIQKVPEMRQLLETGVNTSNEVGNEEGLLRVPLFLKLAAESYDFASIFSNKLELIECYIKYQLSRSLREGERFRKEKRSWAYKSINDEPDFEQTKKYIQWLAKKVLDAEITEFQLKWVRYGIRNDENIIEAIQVPLEISWLDENKEKTVYRFLYLSILAILTMTISLAHPYFLIDFFLVVVFCLTLFFPFFGMGCFVGLLTDLFSVFFFKTNAKIVLKRVFIYPIQWIFSVSNSNYWISIFAVLLMFSFWLNIIQSIGYYVIFFVTTQA